MFYIDGKQKSRYCTVVGVYVLKYRIYNFQNEVI